MTRLLVIVSVAAVGCGGPAVQIDGAVALDAECVARPTNPSLQRGLVDIGFDASTANEYTAALIVSTSLTDVTFDRVEVWYSDITGEGFLEGPPDFDTPTSPEEVHTVTIGATTASDVVFAIILTNIDAAELQSQPFVQERLQAANASGNTAENRATIAAHMRLRGRTTSGEEVSSQELPFILDLCQGCLVPQCAPGQELVFTGCVPGQDNGVGICE